MLICYRIKVFGLVQGVFFRTSAKEQADKLGLVGYVSNLSDGSVEVVIQGEEKELKKFMNWLKEGSSLSRVERLETKKVSNQDLDGFEIRD